MFDKTIVKKNATPIVFIKSLYLKNCFYVERYYMDYINHIIYIFLKVYEDMVCSVKNSVLTFVNKLLSQKHHFIYIYEHALILCNL